LKSEARGFRDATGEKKGREPDKADLAFKPVER